MILYMYIAPRPGLTTHWGQNFDVNRNILSLQSFVASLKKISLKSDFIHFSFHDFIHVYSPGQRQTAPRGQNFDVNRNVSSPQDQDSLLVKRRNGNHSPGPVIRELVPSSHRRSELSNTILCIFSRRDQRIGEDIPIPNSLGKEATFINICISNGSLKCHRVLISTTPSFGDQDRLNNFRFPIPWRLHKKFGFSRLSGF